MVPSLADETGLICKASLVWSLFATATSATARLHLHLLNVLHYDCSARAGTDAHPLSVLPPLVSKDRQLVTGVANFYPASGFSSRNPHYGSFVESKWLWWDFNPRTLGPRLRLCDLATEPNGS